MMTASIDKDALLRECLPCIAVAAKVAADNGQAFLAGSRIDLESRITAALAEKDDGDALFFLDRDNDSHWYVVPEANRKEWDRWLNIPSSDAASWDIPDFAKPVGGAPNTVLFSLPPLPKGDE